ncbi:hypothetical protein MY3296_007714 [Beauveria thailandica]
MHQTIMRLVGVAAAVLVAANATAVPVLCGAIDAVWQEQAAVAGNYPECESYYDNSNLDQTVDIDPNHPHMARFNACKRYGAATWTCPTIGEHEVEDGAESEQTDQENHESQMARRLLTDDTEPEQPDEADREPTRSGRLCKRSFTDAHWGCPGAGKREVQGTKTKNGNWPPHKREALASSNVDAKVGSGLDVASKSPGNWPPHTRKGLGLNVASKPPGNWPPHKRETLAAANVDAKVGPGLNVASKTQGNWPPHTREEGLGLDALAASNANAKVGLGLDVASKPPGNWPPHKRLDVADAE